MAVRAFPGKLRELRIHPGEYRSIHCCIVRKGGHAAAFIGLSKAEARISSN